MRIYLLSSAGRPAHRSTAQKVDVQVVHGLPAVIARVDDQAKTILQAFGPCQVFGGLKEDAKFGRIIHLGDIRLVITRNNQQMCRRLRVDVAQNHEVVSVFDDSGRNISGDYFAE